MEAEELEYGNFSLIIPATAVKHLIKFMPSNKQCPGLHVHKNSPRRPQLQV